MDFAKEVARIGNAKSLEEIQEIVRSYPVRSAGEKAALYSGMIGNTHANILVFEHATRTQASIIDRTPRGQFLANSEVFAAIKKSSLRIFESEGAASPHAEKFVDDFLYGDAKAPINSPTSVQNCLWCEASRDFAQSLRGDVKFIAVNAHPYRIFGQVEIPTALQYSNARASVGVYT